MIKTYTREQAADAGLVRCMIDGAAGIYVPQRFAENLNPRLWHIGQDDINVLLAGPDHEHYWDTWDHVLNVAEWHKGNSPSTFEAWRLEQDGDLFAYCVQRGGMDIEIED